MLIGITAHQAYRERQMALAMHGTQAQQLLPAYGRLDIACRRNSSCQPMRHCGNAS